MSRRTATIIWIVSAGMAFSCTEATPSPSLSPLTDEPSPTFAVETPTPSASRPSPSAAPPTAPLPPTVTPGPTITATPSASPSALEAVPLSLDIHEIPADYTSSLGVIESLGNEIIWVGSGALWRYTPGAAEPERIVKEDRANPIVSIAGGTGGYLYLTRERSTDQSNPNRWRLWFLAGPGETPDLLDKYDNENVPSPEFAINDHWIVWTAIHGKNDQNALSVLRAVTVDALDQPRDVVSYPATDTNMWNPQLNGDEVWYGVNHNDWTNGLAYPRVEMVDLSSPSPTPVRYGEDVRAFMPSATDAVVAWKGGGDYRFASGGMGELYIYWRDTYALSEVALPDGSSDKVTYPSVGSRFVAWWDENRTHLLLYDLQLREVRVIARYDPTAQGPLVLQPCVRGDLLAFVYTPGEGAPHQLHWALLPE